MRENITYEAQDGKVFTEKEECLAYELMECGILDAVHKLEMYCSSFSGDNGNDCEKCCLYGRMEDHEGFGHCILKSYFPNEWMKGLGFGKINGCHIIE